MSRAERDTRHSSLAAEVKPVSGLSAANREALWRLFEEFYERVDRARFMADLDAKDDIILLWSPAGTPAGFSTLQLETFPLRAVEPEADSGVQLNVIFSGDTIVRPEFWGQTALQRAFVRHVAGIKNTHPDSQVYWHLISKGYKTYLLMTRNFANCWPRVGHITPPLQNRIIDYLSGRRFGDAWHAGRGVVQHDSSRGRLREQVAPIQEKLLTDPDIAFFAARNPGHVNGDELSCLAAVDEDFIAYCGTKYAEANLLQA
jgi:hypothetical protein